MLLLDLLYGFLLFCGHIDRGSLVTFSIANVWHKNPLRASVWLASLKKVEYTSEIRTPEDRYRVADIHNSNPFRT